MDFLEYSLEVLPKELSKSEIIRFFQTKFEKIHHIKGKLINHPENPRLRYEFSSITSFENIFNRNVPFFEKTLNILESHKINIEELKKKILQDIRPVKSKDQIVLKIATNRKDPIRKNYEFTFNFSEIARINVQYEEIADGFLIFYDNCEIFKKMQENKLERKHLAKWINHLSSYGCSAECIEEILNQI